MNVFAVDGHRIKERKGGKAAIRSVTWIPSCSTHTFVLFDSRANNEFSWFRGLSPRLPGQRWCSVVVTQIHLYTEGDNNHTLDGIITRPAMRLDSHWAQQSPPTNVQFSVPLNFILIRTVVIYLQ